jgi:translation elongation factor EF-1alpha
MSKINELLATEGEAAENVPTPDDGHRRNLNRSVMFSVRFNSEELEELERYADQRGLPARTLARAWILERVREERGQGDSLSQRVARLEEAIFARSG